MTKTKWDTYEKTPIKLKKVRKNTTVIKPTDIGQMTTGDIIWHLILRHDRLLLLLALGVSWSWYIVTKL